MNGRKAREQRQESLSIKTPEPYGTIIDTVCAADRLYCRERPDVSGFVRQRVPGEFWPYEDRFPCETHTLVQPLVHGVRRRTAIILLQTKTYPSGRIPWEHIEAATALCGKDNLFVVDQDPDDEGGAA